MKRALGQGSKRLRQNKSYQADLHRAFFPSCAFSWSASHIGQILLSA
jgi:hypothetical protein